MARRKRTTKDCRKCGKPVNLLLLLPISGSLDFKWVEHNDDCANSPQFLGTKLKLNVERRAAAERIKDG